MNPEEPKPIELKPTEKAIVPVKMNNTGVMLTSLEEAMRFCKWVIASKLAPTHFDTPEKVFIAIQTGAELGMSAMTSVNSLVVVNGKVGMYAETAKALAMASGLVEDFQESLEGIGETRTAVITTKRKGVASPLTTRFSLQDAKKAGLTGKKVWQDYLDRMLTARATGFNMRDLFPDVIKGIRTAEELQDMVEVVDTTPKFDETTVIDIPAPYNAGVTTGTNEGGAIVNRPTTASPEFTGDK